MTLNAPARPVPGVRSAFAVLLLVQFVLVVNDTVVYVALPPMARALQLSATQVAWVMNAFMIGLGGFLLVGGHIADRLGRRRALTVALVGFAAASAVCALTSTPAVLLVGRAGQGIAGALATPAAMALITDLFPPGPERYRAIGLFAGMGGVAGATGALIGGALTSIGWPAVFAVNVPAIALILLGVRLLPDTRYPGPRPRIDVAVTAIVGICLLLLTVTRAASHAPAAPTAAVALAALGALTVFVVMQHRAAAPLIPRALAGSRAVRMGNLANACTGFAMFGGFLALTMYLQDVERMRPLHAAAWMLPVSLALFAGSRLALHRIARHGTPPVMLAAATAQIIGLLAWVTGFLHPTPAHLGYLLPGVIWGAGLGAGLVTGFGASTHTVATGAQGVAAALVNTALQLGGALGVTTVGLLTLAGGTPTVGTVTNALLTCVVAALVAAAASTRLPKDTE